MDKNKITTNFLSLAAAILFFFALFHLGTIKDFFGMFVKALQPLWVGIAFAYLLYPAEAFFERQIKKLKPIARAARPLAVLITSVAVLAFFSLLCAVLLPQLVTSVGELATSLPWLLEKQITKLRDFLQNRQDFVSFSS